jgi:hypothetical protein
LWDGTRKDKMYRAFHIRCSTARHERSCAARPQCEQGNSKKVVYSQNPMNCSKPFPVPFSGKMAFSLDV